MITLEIVTDFYKTGFLRAPVALFEPGEAALALNSSAALAAQGVAFLSLPGPIDEDIQYFAAHQDFLYQPCFVHWRKRACTFQDEIAKRSDLSARARKRRIKSHNLKLSQSAAFNCAVKSVADGYADWYPVYDRAIIATRDGWGYRAMHPDFTASQESCATHIGIYLQDDDQGEFLGGYIVEVIPRESILKIKAGAFHPDAPYSRSYLTYRALHVLNDFALSNGYKFLSYGHDSNFYGEFLTTGLAQFKLSNGFTPECWRAAHHPEFFSNRRILKLLCPSSLRAPFLTYQFSYGNELVANVAGNLAPDFPLPKDHLRTL